MGSVTSQQQINMLLPVILSLLALTAVQGTEIDDDTMDKINRWNLLSFCYGQEWLEQFGELQYKLSIECGATPSLVTPTANLQLPVTANVLGTTYHVPTYMYAPVITPGVYGKKKKRQATASPDLSGLFSEGLADYQMEMASKIGNLSCVLKGMGILDAAGNINAASISYEKLTEEMSKTKAGSDPAFLIKLAQDWNDCLDIPNTWPQKALDRHPMLQMYGRQYIFFDCMKRTEVQACAKFQLSQYVESMLGNNQLVDSLPGDKYDKANMAYDVLVHATTPAEKFIDDFFWGKV